MKNILDYTLDELKLWMKSQGEKEFRAKQVFDWIYKGTYNFEGMKNLSKNTIEKLNMSFDIILPKVLKVYKSKDNCTFKFLFQLNDGNIIESVVMKYEYGNSICVSTQVGCRMGCKFCASTIDGMVRNLSSGEILSQIIKAQDVLKETISNVVLMGSGEPLDNYDNVIKFLEIVNEKNGLNIGQRHITLSTCGIVPKIIDLADKKLQITLAISLHAPNNEMRRYMMPITNKYPIEDVIKSCIYYTDVTNRRITFEYALIKGINDSKETAVELANILKGLLCHVNLIPVNKIKENTLERSSDAVIKEFKNVLLSKGIETTVRKKMGTDIDAACGQLRRNFINSECKIKGCE